MTKLKTDEQPIALSRATFTPARENPFAMDRLERLDFRFLTGDWEQHLKRLAELSYRAAIVGPQGSGKTTLLEQLGPKLLSECGLRSTMSRVSENRSEHADCVSMLVERSHRGQVILLDSAERLSRRLWYKLCWRTKSQAGLVVAVHHRCILPTWIHTETSGALMESLVGQLELSLGPCIRTAARKALRSHHGNVRDAFRQLYDQCASGETDFR